MEFLLLIKGGKMQKGRFLTICNTESKYVTKIIFRVATKMLAHIQTWILKKISCLTEPASNSPAPSMSEEEEKKCCF